MCNKKNKNYLCCKNKNNCATYINIRDFSDGLQTKAGQGQIAGVLHRLLTKEKLSNDINKSPALDKSVGLFAFEAVLK